MILKWGQHQELLVWADFSLQQRRTSGLPHGNVSASEFPPEGRSGSRLHPNIGRRASAPPASPTLILTLFPGAARDQFLPRFPLAIVMGAGSREGPSVPTLFFHVLEFLGSSDTAWSWWECLELGPLEATSVGAASFFRDIPRDSHISDGLSAFVRSPLLESQRLPPSLPEHTWLDSSCRRNGCSRPTAQRDSANA